MARIYFFDIGEKELRRYAIDVKGDHYAIKEQRDFPLTDANEMPAGAAPDRNETAYVSIPLSSLNFRVVDLPFSDKERVRQVLPFELDGLILGGSGGVVFDAVIVGKSDSGYQVLAAYTEKGRIRKLLQGLKDLGVDPVCITSLELRQALDGFSVSKLILPPSLTDEARQNLAVEEIKDPTVNLRCGEYAYTRDRDKTRKALKVTALLISLILLVAGIDMVFRIVAARQEALSLRNEIRKAYLDLFPGEKNIMNEIHQVKSRIRELKGREEIFVGIKPLEVFAALAQIERDGARFYEVNMERGKLSFRGEAGSLSAVQEIQERLNKYFDDVSISSSETSAQGTTRFTMTAKERKA